MQNFVSAVRELSYYSQGTLFFLGLLTFIIIIMLFYVANSVIAVWMKRAETLNNSKEIADRLVLLEKSFAQSGTHLDQLEKRLANLESIVLEHEKVREFDRALQ